MKKMRIAAMLAVMVIVLGFGYAAPKSDVADVVTVLTLPPTKAVPAKSWRLTARSI